MTLLQITLVYMLRVEVSVAIVEMMNDSTAISEIEDVTGWPALSNSTLKHDIKKDKVYDWSSETQGWILSAFYYGYIVSQIPGGYLAMRFGGKLVLGFAVLLSSVSTLLVPLAAELGAPCVIALRVLAGLAEGPCFPAVHHIWSQWAPAHEQSRFINLAHSGSSFGTVISFVLSGLICYHLGWSYSFYIFGSLGIAWCLVWSQLVSDAPETHRTISDAERDYIISSRLKQASTQQQSIPWESILKSSAVWAIIAGYLSGIFIFYTLIAVLPTYMQNIFQLTIQQNGFLSALQLMPGFLFQNIAAVIADYMKKTGKFSTALIRKGFACTGRFGIIKATEDAKARLAACREDISKCEREQITFSMKREQKLLEMKVIKEQLMQNKVMSAGKQARLAQLAEVQETLKQCTTFLSLLEGKVSCLHCQDQCFFHVDTLVTTIRDIIHHLVEGLSNDHCKPLCTELGEVMSHELNSMKETISHISVCGAGV
eukprot:gi/632979943/ref/XP_007906752.1/ PREDICTED: LOW QUALITY PROTEIN: sialin-like [Callorhinchus milii]